MRKFVASRRAGAFTLIELLVVIAIVAVLSGLLLPAVQKVREAANRARCANNLKQLSLAVHNYHDSYGRLPINRYGAYFPPNFHGSDQNSYSWSWLAVLLPFLEEDNLYRQGNIPQTTLSGSGVMAEPIKLFFCPSDQGINIQVWIDDQYMPGALAAITNYKGVMGSNWAWGDYQNSGTINQNNGHLLRDPFWNGDGIFWVNSWLRPLRLTDITDGTSHTAMIGEDVFNLHPPALGGSFNSPGASWVESPETILTCAIPPNATRPNGQPYDFTSDDENAWGFKSRHPQGVQFAFADGSVHFMSNSIGLLTYRALGTIRGNEVLQDY
jgi:prepilin-type N-terminal cleavage/methylation domain-containing protein/prepilin-type processing-associated H-X9-DG protein